MSARQRDGLHACPPQLVPDDRADPARLCGRKGGVRARDKQLPEQPADRDDDRRVVGERRTCDREADGVKRARSVEAAVDDFYQGLLPAAVPYFVLERHVSYLGASGPAMAATLGSALPQLAVGVLADLRRVQCHLLAGRDTRAAAGGSATLIRSIDRHPAIDPGADRQPDVRSNC
jgi:hypothetical protein